MIFPPHKKLKQTAYNTGLAKWLFSNSINHSFLILKFSNSIELQVQPLRQARNRYAKL